MHLSERQQRTVAAAITILSALVILAALGGVFWLIAIFVRAFSHVFLPLAVAAVAALVSQPYYNLLRDRLGLPTPAALVALFLSILIPIGVFLVFFGIIISQQVSELIEQFPGWWDNLMRELNERLPQVKEFLATHPLGQRIQSLIQGRGEQVFQDLQYFGDTAVATGAEVARWTGSLLAWAVTPVYFVFILIAKRRDVAHLDEYLPFLKPETRKVCVFLAQEFVNIIVAFFRGQLIIAFLQGVLFAVGFSLVGLKYGLVLGLVVGLLNVIPYLGSMVGLGMTLPLAYFQNGGGLWTLVGVIVVYLVVQTIEGYWLTPKIMGDRTGLHPMAIIVAIFFWGSALGGILGMILAIPLTAFLVVFWRLAKEKYIEEWV